MKGPWLFISWQVCLLSSIAALAQTPAPVSAEPQSITLPVGTAIAIRTIDRIDSKTADLHREYAASLDDPIVVDDVTVVPTNTSAVVRVTDKQRSGFKRRASLSLSLIAVTINGQRVSVETGKLDSQSGSQAKRTATGAAVGAGTGAAIGAIAGGGLGAGIGAAAGGAAGTLGGVLVGQNVVIAPETRFTYRLTEAVVIDAGSVSAQQPRQRPTLEHPAALRPDPQQPAPQALAPPQATDQPQPIPPPPAPVDSSPGSPKVVSLGQTTEQVVAILGPPDTIAKVADKEIYAYRFLKITLTDGKVTDIQ